MGTDGHIQACPGAPSDVRRTPSASPEAWTRGGASLSLLSAAPPWASYLTLLGIQSPHLQTGGHGEPRNLLTQGLPSTPGCLRSLGPKSMRSDS